MARFKAVRRKAPGLFSQWNPFEAPEGALSEADNCVIDREEVIGKRRGLDRYGTTLSNAPSAFLDFKNRVIVHDGTTLRYDSDGLGAWTAWTGSFTSPATDRRLRGHEARSNLYFATDTGIQKSDALTTSPTPAGLGKPPHLRLLQLDANSAWLAAGDFVGYKAVVERKDANSFTLISAPSERLVAENTDVVVHSPRRREYGRRRSLAYP